MRGRGVAWVSLLVLVAFVAGFGGCVFACAEDDHAAEADLDQHCVLHCACCSVAVMPAATQPAWSAPLGDRLLGEAPPKLPQFVATIFQPPKA